MNRYGRKRLICYTGCSGNPFKALQQSADCWDEFDAGVFGLLVGRYNSRRNQKTRRFRQSMTEGIQSIEKDCARQPGVSAPLASVRSPLSELDQWVSAERLLEILWDEQSRPSLQWIRKETKRRMLPHIRRGRLIFYRPRSVMEWYSQSERRPNSMK